MDVCFIDGGARMIARNANAIALNGLDDCVGGVHFITVAGNICCSTAPCTPYRPGRALFEEYRADTPGQQTDPDYHQEPLLAEPDRVVAGLRPDDDIMRVLCESDDHD